MYSIIENILQLPAGNEGTVVIVTALVAFAIITFTVTLLFSLFERILNGNKK